MTARRLQKLIRLTVRRARRRPLGRRALVTLTTMVVTALPAHYDATGYFEYHDLMRERTTAGWMTHESCMALDSDKPVVVCADGAIWRINTGTRPDTRLYQP